MSLETKTETKDSEQPREEHKKVFDWQDEGVFNWKQGFDAFYNTTDTSVAPKKPVNNQVYSKPQTIYIF